MLFANPVQKNTFSHKWVQILGGAQGRINPGVSGPRSGEDPLKSETLEGLESSLRK